MSTNSPTHIYFERSNKGTARNSIAETMCQHIESQGKKAFLASLNLVEIDWEQTSLTVLAKLIEYEAVHKMDGWEELKSRLKEDRKIYALFHESLPDEPLIFVQVAFVCGMADNIQKLLDPDAPTLAVTDADTALFYSISNTQPGLKGVSFGNFLIKQVVAKLADQHPNIKHFATLSPIPGFRQWLDPLLAKSDSDLLAKEEQALVKEVLDASKSNSLADFLDANWQQEPNAIQELKPLLMRLCIRYLMQEKSGSKPLDPVANFHLFNGARIERLNYLADTSDKGMKQSAGLMVNYYYELSDIEANHHAFAEDGKIVASTQFQR